MRGWGVPIATSGQTLWYARYICTVLCGWQYLFTRNKGEQGSSEPEFVNLLRSPGINSQPGRPVRQPYLTYRPARLYTVGCRNRFLGSLNVYKFGLLNLEEQIYDILMMQCTSLPFSLVQCKGTNVSFLSVQCKIWSDVINLCANMIRAHCAHP